MTETKQVIFCGLCGQPIPEPPKGFPKNRLTKEQQERVHATCKETYVAIRAKYNLNQFSVYEAYRNGMLELFPELAETKPVKEYREKIAAENADLYEAFPFLKAQHTATVKAAVKATVEAEETNPNKVKPLEMKPGGKASGAKTVEVLGTPKLKKKSTTKTTTKTTTKKKTKKEVPKAE